MDELLESCLLSLGVATPVTRQSAGSLYHQQLSQQLADFLGPQLERARGVLTLPDVFCLFNRARGSELVSPSDVIKACSLWERMRVPLRLHRFSNRVLAVMSTSFDTDKVNRALVDFAREHAETGIGVAEAARVVGMAPAIAREQLLAAELQGALCRDEAPDGVRWFCNPWRE